jgi:hypothetical protein
MIENNASITDLENINDLRGAIEHRATWFYELLNEAMARGLDTSFAHDAIYKCGSFHGLNKFPRTNDIKEFAASFANEKVRKIFEMDVDVTDEAMNITFHYCPLVKAWQKLGCDEKFIADMCDIAMDGDRGIVSEYDEFEFELGGTIAQGNKTCSLCVKKCK